MLLKVDPRSGSMWGKGYEGLVSGQIIERGMSPGQGLRVRPRSQGKAFGIYANDAGA